jgi:alcohol dehydrogenase (cytochrome c)
VAVGTAALVAASIVTAVGIGATGATITPAPVLGVELNELPGDDWATVGGNVWNQRYSSLTQINTNNVKRLKLVYTKSLDGPTGAEIEGSPLVYQGVMYIATGESHVAALDAASGETLWKYQQKNPPINAYGIAANRGLSIGDGRVYVAMPDATVVALDQQTGRKLWASEPVSSLKTFLGPAVPLYYDGLVYIGHSGSDAGARGHVDALNAKTGRRVWRFYTVPGPGKLGHNTWSGDEWKHGGASPWTYGPIDSDLGLMYVTTANAYPYSGRGPGHNLFSSSVVALDLKTGKYRWHFQAVHHDMWDYDCSEPPSLFNITIKGVERKGLELVCKSGYIFELDRVTGKPLLPIKETKVPSFARGQNAAKTQPIPQGDAVIPRCATKANFPFDPPDGKPMKFGCTYAAYGTDRYTAMAPAFNGGPDWPPMSQDPTLDRVFVCAQVSFTALKATGKPGAPQFAGGFSPPTSGERLAGTFSALNLHTNKIVWQKKWYANNQGACYGGSAATAGGVVFAGDMRGHFYAWSSKTGRELWKKNVAMPISAPPITYAVNGRQFVAVYAGGPSAIFQKIKVKRDILYVYALG